MKIFVKTLGCRANRYESEKLMKRLRENEHVLVSTPNVADVVIVNTCTVTHIADRKSRQEIYPHVNKKRIIVFGCGPRVNKDSFQAIKGVDFVTGEPDKIVEFLGKSSGSAEKSEEVFTTRLNLKIQDGCENYCTYCIVPFSRGKCISKPLDKILEEAAVPDVKEIVLTGINIGKWRDGKADFWELVKFLLKKSYARLRISSIEPFEFNHKVETVLKHPCFCKHLHICLQSGSDSVLKRMNRHYRTVDFENLIKNIRKIAPDIAITTDLIVGFPGETAKEHKETLNFIRKIGFAKIHIFKFSRRKETGAYFIKNQIPYSVKVRRAKEVAEIERVSRLAYREKFIGRVKEILFEREKNGIWNGLTDNYLKVRIKSSENLRNTIKRLKILS